MPERRPASFKPPRFTGSPKPFSKQREQAQQASNFPQANPLLEEARQLRLKRRFSQNFLINEGVLTGIANALHLQPGEAVLEIGAGAGFLTQALLRTHAKVTAVELDRGMCRYLRQKFVHPLLDYRLAGEKPDNIREGAAPPASDDSQDLPTPTETAAPPEMKQPPVDSGLLHLIEGDFLKLAPDAIVSDAELPFPGTTPEGLAGPNAKRTFKVVGNLPYGITSRILFKLAGEIEDVEHAWREHVSQITVMVQKEVGERITAKPGSKAYNALSIALQLRYQTKLEFLVTSRNFYPAPKVDSAVVTLIPRDQPLIAADKIPQFAKLVRSAFSSKRKTIRNALLNSGFADAATIDRVFSEAGIDSKNRAEALSIAEFGELTNAFGLYASQG